jgi:hypothetical protein
MYADGNQGLFNVAAFDYFRVQNLATVYTLPIKKVSYRWSGRSGRSADVDIGDYNQTLDQEFVDFNRKIKNAELLAEKT